MRRILANLDGEAELAAARGGARALPQPALAAAAAAGTLLRALGSDGDRLHTPLPVAPERLAEVAGLPRPRLESGPLSRLEPAELLAWLETPRAAALRLASRPLETDLDAPLHELLWRLPAPGPEAVATVHRRSFALELARELGWALPGARLVDSPAGLRAHLEAGGARAATAGGWVLKTPYSAAGRERIVATGAAVSETALEELFTRPGPLLFEPWMERVADFGAIALALPEGARLLGFHRSRVDGRGRFRGIELRAGHGDDGAPGLGANEAESLRQTVRAAAAALARRGYVGPFGIDAWRYRTRAGALAFQPLGELNARLTMGHLARALLERLRRPLAISDEALLRLRLGRRPGADAVPLLHPGPPRDFAAWLEIAPEKASR